VGEEESGMTRLLDGVRILAIEQFGAGPYGSMFLADLGAEVIKIENAATGGEASRHVGPHMLGENDSHYFQSFNFNKKSVVLDLKSPEGRAALLRLVESSDAILNNLRGDQPEKLGIDYASLKAANPAIVCLHISAYGRDNSRAAWPGYDYLMQAEAGLMSVTGEPDGPPSRLGLSMIDYMTGITGMVGLLSGIIRARQTGEGCDVDASLFDVALHQLSYLAVWYLNQGDVPRRLPRSAHPSLVPVQTYRTKDGWIFVMCMKESFWEALVDAIGRPELKSDPRFAGQAARRQNRDLLMTVLDETFSTRPTAEWLTILTGKVPVAPVHDVTQTLASTFVTETGMIHTVPHPANPDLKALKSPLKVNGRRPDQVVCSALGADDETYLGTKRAIGDPGCEKRLGEGQAAAIGRHQIAPLD
jgi:crotonobetainyl-CoA:carnitine CoA-transferase CaiB-like acyl-CoA transferase